MPDCPELKKKPAMVRKILLLALLLAAAAGAWYAFPAPVLVNDPPHAGPIIALGDSLTFGTGAKPEESYPARLSATLGRPVLNAGVPGNTVAQAAARLDTDVLARKPGLVIVCLGGNDFLQKADLDASFDGLESIIKRIQRTGALVALAAIDMPFPLNGMNKRYRALARKTGALFISNVLSGIVEDKALMSDQVHPNAEGYKIMTKRIASAIKSHLPPRSPAPAETRVSN